MMMRGIRVATQKNREQRLLGKQMRIDFQEKDGLVVANGNSKRMVLAVCVPGVVSSWRGLQNSGGRAFQVHECAVCFQG